MVAAEDLDNATAPLTCDGTSPPLGWEICRGSVLLGGKTDSVTPSLDWDSDSRIVALNSDVDSVSAPLG